MDTTIFYRNCDECGIKYPDLRCRLTCSDECRRIRSNKQSVYRHSFDYKPKVRKTCITCGEKFNSIQGSKSCSDVCRVKRRKNIFDMYVKKPENIARKSQNYKKRYKALKNQLNVN